MKWTIATSIGILFAASVAAISAHVAPAAPPTATPAALAAHNETETDAETGTNTTSRVAAFVQHPIVQYAATHPRTTLAAAVLAGTAVRQTRSIASAVQDHIQRAKAAALETELELQHQLKLDLELERELDIYEQNMEQVPSLAIMQQGAAYAQIRTDVETARERAPEKYRKSLKKIIDSLESRSRILRNIEQTRRPWTEALAFHFTGEIESLPFVDLSTLWQIENQILEKLTISGLKPSPMREFSKEGVKAMYNEAIADSMSRLTTLDRLIKDLITSMAVRLSRKLEVFMRL